jgi:DNA-binding NarL/FixJ family response regulator
VNLSPHLAEVARMIAEGYTAKEISVMTGKTKETINQQTAEIYRRLELKAWGNLRVRLANLMRGAA